MICITCKGRFIPVFKCCPRDFRNSAVTFLWVLCSHLSRKLWREMRNGSCSCSLGFARVQLNQQNPAEVQHTSATRTNACTITVFVSEKATQSFYLLLTRTISVPQFQPASMCKCIFFPNNHRKKWKGKKKSDLFEFVGRNYVFFGLWVSMASFRRLLILCDG